MRDLISRGRGACVGLGSCGVAFRIVLRAHTKSGTRKIMVTKTPKDQANTGGLLFGPRKHGRPG